MPILRDWLAKKALLQALHSIDQDTEGNKALVVNVTDCVFTDRDKLREFIIKCSDALRKWKDGNLIKPVSLPFWDGVIRDQQLVNATDHLVVSCSFLDFVKLFPDKAKLKAALPDFLSRLSHKKIPIDSATVTELEALCASGVAPTTTASAAPSVHENTFIMHASSKLSFQGPSQGFQDGRIHVHQFYSTPETANAWATLVDSQQYKMYLDCLLSLKRLNGFAEWNRAVSCRRFNAAVTLGGGGSPEKDWILATNLLKALTDNETVKAADDNNTVLEYVINDISPYMLHKTMQSFLRRIESERNAAIGSGLVVTPLLSDFMHLDTLYHRPRKWDLAVWAILGGTIGNVKEEDFFRSIRGPLKVGDLLLVGLDTINSETFEEFEKRMDNVLVVAHKRKRQS